MFLDVRTMAEISKDSSPNFALNITPIRLVTLQSSKLLVAALFRYLADAKVFADLYFNTLTFCPMNELSLLIMWFVKACAWSWNYLN